MILRWIIAEFTAVRGSSNPAARCRRWIRSTAASSSAEPMRAGVANSTAPSVNHVNADSDIASRDRFSVVSGDVAGEG